MDAIVAEPKKKTQEDFLSELGEQCLKEYEILENYINIDTKIQFKHKKCNTIFKIPYTEISNINQILSEILKEKSSTTIEKYLVTE